MKVKNDNLKLKTFFIKKFKSFALYVLVLSFALYALRFNVKPVLAQNLSLSIWPPLLEVTIQPGRSVTQVYKLTNNSDYELKIFPQIFPFVPDGENGQIKIKFSQDSVSLSPTNFFSFESREKFKEFFYLPSGKTRELILKISIPKDNPEEDYYYTLLFSTAIESEQPATQKVNESSSVTKIGTNILITVSKTEKPLLLAKIVDFSAPKVIDSLSPVSFTVRLENWGKTLWKPFGKIKIVGILKQEEKISLLEQNILGNSLRQLEIKPWKPRLPIGPFKATLEFSPNNENEVLSKEITFWYFPYKTVGVIFTFISAIFLIKHLKKL